VHIPIDFLFQCYDDLMAAPGQTLPLQRIIKDTSDSIRFGESIIGATLVAAGLAEVINRKPIMLRGIEGLSPTQDERGWESVSPGILLS